MADPLEMAEEPWSPVPPEELRWAGVELHIARMQREVDAVREHYPWNRLRRWLTAVLHRKANPEVSSGG